MLGLVLFTLDTIPLGKVRCRLWTALHCCGNETQFYIRTDTHSPPSAAPTHSTSTICLVEIKAWMRHNFLQLNHSKMVPLKNGSLHHMRISRIACITFCITFSVIPRSSTVTSPGIRFDNYLNLRPTSTTCARYNYFNSGLLLCLCQSLLL